MIRAAIHKQAKRQLELSVGVQIINGVIDYFRYYKKNPGNRYPAELFKWGGRG